SSRTQRVCAKSTAGPDELSVSHLPGTVRGEIVHVYQASHEMVARRRRGCLLALSVHALSAKNPLPAREGGIAFPLPALPAVDQAAHRAETHRPRAHRHRGWASYCPLGRTGKT